MCTVDIVLCIDAHMLEASFLIDANGALIEGHDVEVKYARSELLACKVQTGLDEGQAQIASASTLLIGIKV